jgi:hypothetical protein
VRRGDVSKSTGKYSDNLDYLLALIVNLATSPYWGRIPKNIAVELSLDEEKTRKVLSEFEGIFRRSMKRSTKYGDFNYSLQARHAQRQDYEFNDPDGEHDIPPLSDSTLSMLIGFVRQSAESEERREQTKTQNKIAIATSSAAALLSLVGIIVTLLTSK